MPLCSCSIQSSCLCFIIIGLPISFCAYFKSVGISLQAMLSSLYSSMLNFFFPHFLLQIISVRTGPQEHQTYGQTEKKKTTTQKRPEPISKRISNTQKSSQFLSQLTGNAGIHSVVLCVLYTHRVIIFFFFCCFCCCFFSARSEVFFYILFFIPSFWSIQKRSKNFQPHCSIYVNTSGYIKLCVQTLFKYV